MGVAFLGYSLVWGQIRFWAVVVITSLFSVIPFLGEIVVFWVWGGFVVRGLSVSFFFTLHFFLPLLLLLVVGVHLFVLHHFGRSSVLYLHRGAGKLSFFPYYWYKDAVNLRGFIVFFFAVFLFPFVLGDPEGFVEANPIASPVHILPE